MSNSNWKSCHLTLLFCYANNMVQPNAICEHCIRILIPWLSCCPSLYFISFSLLTPANQTLSILLILNTRPESSKVIIHVHLFPFIAGSTENPAENDEFHWTKIPQLANVSAHPQELIATQSQPLPIHPALINYMRSDPNGFTKCIPKFVSHSVDFHAIVHCCDLGNFQCWVQGCKIHPNESFICQIKQGRTLIWVGWHVGIWVYLVMHLRSWVRIALGYWLKVYWR